MWLFNVRFSVYFFFCKQPPKDVFIQLSEITYFVELLNGSFQTILGINWKS